MTANIYIYVFSMFSCIQKTNKSFPEPFQEATFFVFFFGLTIFLFTNNGRICFFFTVQPFLCQVHCGGGQFEPVPALIRRWYDRAQNHNQAGDLKRW